jgi:HEAT repeat protein
MGNPVAVEGLVLVLMDEERAVRAAADTALGRIDPQWHDSEAAQRAAEQIEACLDNRPAWVRAAGLQVLARLRPASAPAASADSPIPWPPSSS